MSLLEVLLTLNADIQVRDNNDLLITQAYERIVKPGWYQQDNRFYIHDINSTGAASGASGMMFSF